ncbi:uncharacterized protein LOC105008064 isoform X3 [Esox lucius]|uniref:uncharacterized protein LOC105008064 isoform X3 n=1 Tax=Esox lucius TaxID=8010 RepID=UPI0009734418|nr:uncharacterized protein LOC105008064 isoform X3 [Esox lucius]
MQPRAHAIKKAVRLEAGRRRLSLQSLENLLSTTKVHIAMDINARNAAWSKIATTVGLSAQGHSDGYQVNMNSGLIWIFGACLSVCLWRACQCNCPYQTYLENMVVKLPKNYLFFVKIEDKSCSRSVQDALHLLYCQNQSLFNDSVFYLLSQCFNVTKSDLYCNDTCTTFDMDADIYPVEDFTCLVKKSINDSENCTYHSFVSLKTCLYPTQEASPQTPGLNCRPVSQKPSPSSVAATAAPITSSFTLSATSDRSNTGTRWQPSFDMFSTVAT